MATPPPSPRLVWPLRWQAALVAQWQRPPPTSGARLLQPLAWLYGALAKVHRALYRYGLLRVHHAPRPLIVVGNLVAGGAGKTPAVIALLRLLREQGYRPGVIARGYASRGRGVREVDRQIGAGEVGDEPLLIHLRTAAPVTVAADRAAAARALCDTHPEVDIIVADDGLQHHALARDVDVLVFDERGAGNGLLLPAGPLRQRLPSRVPARSIVLYSAARASTHLPGFIGRRRLGGVVPLAEWWQGAVPRAGSLGALAGRTMLAVAGLARPENFFAMLEAQGLRIHRLPLPDHHAYDTLPWPDGTTEVIVTEKDAVKLRPGRVGSTRVWVATLDFEPDAEFAAALRSLLPHRDPSP